MLNILKLFSQKQEFSLQEKNYENVTEIYNSREEDQQKAKNSKLRQLKLDKSLSCVILHELGLKITEIKNFTNF